MNSGYLLKWFAPVEVQDEERPTHPALLRSSTSHTSSTLMIQVESYYSFFLWNEWKLWMLERVCGGSFYSFKGQFPPSSNMETCSTAFGWIRENHRPKCTWTGACLGSAEPGVRPAPQHHLWPPSFAGWLVSGPSLVYVGAGVSFVGLLYFVGHLCKCDTGLDILCNCVASFVCFCSIPGMGACNTRITKTRGNG